MAIPFLILLAIAWAIYLLYRPNRDVLGAVEVEQRRRSDLARVCGHG